MRVKYKFSTHCPRDLRQQLKTLPSATPAFLRSQAEASNPNRDTLSLYSNDLTVFYLGNNTPLLDMGSSYRGGTHGAS